MSDERPVALITGASSGIGAGIARRFAAGRWDLVVVARRRERLEALAAELAPQARVEVLVGDVRDPSLPAAAVDRALAAFGRLDCLVNNAGAGKWMPVGDTDDATLDEVIEVSLKAPFRFAREAVRTMKQGSSIVNIGSVWGLVSGMAGGPYAVVKAGLVGLTRSLAADYGPRGIRANLVAPGVIRTEMTDAYWDTEYFRRTNQELTPFHREGTVEDVANAVFFLASPEGSYINGETLALDGGWTYTRYLSPAALAR